MHDVYYAYIGVNAGALQLPSPLQALVRGVDSRGLFSHVEPSVKTCTWDSRGPYIVAIAYWYSTTGVVLRLPDIPGMSKVINGAVVAQGGVAEIFGAMNCVGSSC